MVSQNNKEDFNVLNDIDKPVKEMTVTEHFEKFVLGTFMGCGALFIFITLNFVGLSCCLTLNKDRPMSEKFAPMVFSFLFGFMYLALYVFGVHIGRKKQTVDFDKNNLFPF